ncbi:DNA cytosine methyltransferase [Exiguobacterium sp. s192]|uniref:DNA cytosine methyltransferase n=1 Tax=Exiguobacterium sp. s192 TaxID=2751206 RepID=UPI001BE8815F|nr:DNA cytosine methyltransferase [Exiguobacterium sp. s192]
MTNLVNVFSNNVFDLNIISKKEFIEIINNFNKTVESLGYKSGNSVLGQETINMLNEFGVISKQQSLKEIQKIMDETMLKNLILSFNALIDADMNVEEAILKYSKKYRELMVENEKKSKKPTLVDLFCGAGGMSLGFTQKGFRVIFANDIEKAALRTYAFNHPEIDGKHITMGGIEDIAHNIHEYILEDADVLIGGPPCQGFSTANRQRIIDDPRNVLYKYYVESVKNLKPKLFVMENVKGMKNVASEVVEDFNANVATHYDISYVVLNARDFGVPQNRERLIYIGLRQDIVESSGYTASEVIGNLINSSNDTERVLFDAIGDLRSLSASRERNSTENDNEESGFKIENFDKANRNNYLTEINPNTNDGLIFNHKARYNNDRDIEIFQRMLPGDKSDSERIADIMPYKSRSHMFKDKYYKLIPNKPCKTITAHMKFDCNMYIHPFQARGLTPREAARVQSYPDDYFFLGAYTKTYMQIGNSVPPLLAKKIAGNLIYILNNLNRD